MPSDGEGGICVRSATTTPRHHVTTSKRNNPEPRFSGVTSAEPTVKRSEPWVMEARNHSFSYQPPPHWKAAPSNGVGVDYFYGSTVQKTRGFAALRTLAMIFRPLGYEGGCGLRSDGLVCQFTPNLTLFGFDDPDISELAEAVELPAESRRDGILDSKQKKNHWTSPIGTTF